MRFHTAKRACRQQRPRMPSRPSVIPPAVRSGSIASDLPPPLIAETRTCAASQLTRGAPLPDIGQPMHNQDRLANPVLETKIMKPLFLLMLCAGPAFAISKRRFARSPRALCRAPDTHLKLAHTIPDRPNGMNLGTQKEPVISSDAGRPGLDRDGPKVLYIGEIFPQTCVKRTRRDE